MMNTAAKCCTFHVDRSAERHRDHQQGLVQLGQLLHLCEHSAIKHTASKFDTCHQTTGVAVGTTNQHHKPHKPF